MITLDQLIFCSHAKAHAAAYEIHSAIIKYALKKKQIKKDKTNQAHIYVAPHTRKKTNHYMNMRQLRTMLRQKQKYKNSSQQIGYTHTQPTNRKKCYANTTAVPTHAHPQRRKR
jgi:hypothetical protein